MLPTKDSSSFPLSFICPPMLPTWQHSSSRQEVGETVGATESPSALDPLSNAIDSPEGSFFLSEFKEVLQEQFQDQLGHFPPWDKDLSLGQNLEQALQSFCEEQIEKIIRNSIEIVIEKAVPGALPALKVSEWADVMRPRIEAELLQEIHRYAHTAPNNPLRSLQTYRLTDALFLYAVIETAALPGRVIKCYAQLAYDTLNTLAYWSTRGVLWSGEQIQDWWSWRSQMQHYHHAPLTREPDTQTTTSTTFAQQREENDTLVHQFLEEEKAQDPDTNDAKLPEMPARPAGNVISLGRKKPLVWPNPYQPHPILNHIGGGFSFSSGGGYSAHISFSFGSNHGPTPAQQAALRSGGSGEHPSGARHAAALHLEGLNEPIRNRWNALTTHLNEYITLGNQLNEALDALSEGDTREERIHKLKIVAHLTAATVQVAGVVMDDAYELHDRTCTHAVNQYAHGDKEWKKKVSHWPKINKEVKKILRGEFQVPQLKHLEREHLSLSGRVKTLQETQATCQQSLAILQQEQAIIDIYNQFGTQETGILEQERLNALIDPEQHAQKLAAMKGLADQLTQQVSNSSVPLSPEFAHLSQNVQTRAASLLNRETRYVHIWERYQQLCALDNPSLLTEQREPFNAQIDELIAQSPENTENNAKLLLLKTDVTIRVAANQDRAILGTLQQFRAQENALLEMEGSDAPIDQEQHAQLLTALASLGDQLTNQVTDRAASLPKVPLHPDLASLPQNIRLRVLSLTHRETRYEHICRSYRQLCALDEMLLPQTAANPEALDHFAAQRELLETQIDELIAHSPEDTERNATLLSLKKETTLRWNVLCFCRKPLEEQSLELCNLESQVQQAPNSQEALTTYYRFVSPLFFHLAEPKNCGALAVCFHQRLCFLNSLETLSAVSINEISLMSRYMQEAVIKGNAQPETVVPLLEALAQKPVTEQTNAPLHIAIGELILLCDQNLDPRAQKWYHVCREIQPNNARWPRALATCALHTLHYALAENLLEEAVELAPHDENTQRAISHLVRDRFDNASLLLEWIHLLTTPDTSPPARGALSRLRAFVRPLCNTVHTATHLLMHPTLLKQWMPQVLPSRFKAELVTLLNQDTSTHFSLLNGITLATRVIPIANACIQSYAPKNIVSLYVTTASKGLQQLIGFCLSCINVRNLCTKYREKALTGAELGRHTSFAVLDQLNAGAPVAKKWLFPSPESRRAHPYLYGLVSTLGSTTFGYTLSATQLLLKSSSLIARGVTRLTGNYSSYWGDATYAIAAVYFMYGLRASYLQAQEELASSEPEVSAHTRSSGRTGLLDYMMSWLRAFNPFEEKLWSR